MRHFRLRRVVETFKVESPLHPDVFLQRELLECGHAVRPPQDTSTGARIRTVAAKILREQRRRRCYKCGREHSPQEPLLTPREQAHYTAYRAGWRAGQEAPNSAAENPYPPETPEYRVWNRGQRDAHFQDVASRCGLPGYGPALLPPGSPEPPPEESQS